MFSMCLIFEEVKALLVWWRYVRLVIDRTALFWRIRNLLKCTLPDVIKLRPQWLDNHDTNTRYSIYKEGAAGRNLHSEAAVAADECQPGDSLILDTKLKNFRRWMHSHLRTSLPATWFTALPTCWRHQATATATRRSRHHHQRFCIHKEGIAGGNLHSAEPVAADECQPGDSLILYMKGRSVLLPVYFLGGQFFVLLVQPLLICCSSDAEFFL